MITGINQNVAILGRDFHVQTEISSQDDEHTVRTRVYVAGRIIGAREMTVTSADEAEVKAAMQDQHDTIIDNMRTRLQAIAEAKEAAPRPPVASDEGVPSESELSSAPRRLTKVALPSLDEIPGVRSSVQVRRLLAGFRNAIDLSPPAGHEALRIRLTGAASLIRDLIGTPTFRDVRVDEQVRFNDLLDRIDTWLADPSDHEAGVQLWSQVAVFSVYLGQVNNRTDLVAFDRRLVMWAMSTLGEEGLSQDLMIQLGHLYGRDLAMDVLLNDPTTMDRDSLMHTLMGLLDGF